MKNDPIKKLLIIDDDPFILNSIQRQLKDEKFKTVLLNNPEEGLSELEKGEFDLVLCDVKMEPITGIEVLEIIRQRRPHLPVIMLSGYVDDQLIEKAKKIGCNDFLIKPLRKNELINAIFKVFEK
jgi:two-component system, NtrC family, nitrogen regulation response regulator NtrX